MAAPVSHTPEVHLAPLWPMGIYLAAVILIVGGMLVASHLLGEKKERKGQLPYEGGILPSGFARLRMSTTFYLVAMFFVIFDLEAVFVYAWAVSARELGWPGYIEILIFIGVLAASLAYLWRLGALDQEILASKRRVDRKA